MENQNPPPLNFTQKALPNSTTVLVLGIISIAMCWCYGIVGIILGIIALALSGKPIELYRTNPSIYTEGSFKNAKAGKICAIIGLSLSSLLLIGVIIYFVFWGALLFSIFGSL